MSQCIKLDLCGRMFNVNSDILSNSELFANLLQDSEYDGFPIVMNRSSMLFEHVLAYMIDSTYPYPSKYKSELDYYGIKYQLYKLYDPSPQNQISKLQTKIIKLKKLVKNNYSELEDKISDNSSTTTSILEKLENVEEKIENVEGKIENVEGKIENVETKIEYLKDKVESLGRSIAYMREDIIIVKSDIKNMTCWSYTS